MKKVLSIMLVLLLAFSLVSCGGKSEPTKAEVKTEAKTEVKAEVKAEVKTDKFANGFIVGSTTDLNNDIFNPYWSNGAQNQSLSNLINGYGTYVMSEEGPFVVDPNVVKEEVRTENADGTATYTFTIHDDLVWNEGTPITAKDYVFSILLTSSPEFAAQDSANATSGVSYVGYEAFSAGETKTFSGINLIDDYTFSVTIKAEELPNYFEVTLASVGPLPMFVLAPGVSLTDDGNGATLSDEFTAELLAKTILDPDTGYRYHTYVTCGPYKFVSFNPESLQAVIELNPLYKGNYAGNKGNIERIIFKSVVDATMIDELKAGTVHLLTGVNGGTKIDAGLDLVDGGYADYATYPRAGYGKIDFACEFGPTQFTEVRQALAYCLDRVEFANTWTGGYGVLTHSYYGLSQWEAQESAEFLETELNHYTKDIEKAKEVLIAGDWTLNENGDDFVEGVDEIRYKWVDGELMPCVIEWASSENNPISDMLAIRLPSETLKIGMKVNQTIMDFGTLLDHLYRPTEDLNKYHMFNLATGFATTNPVWYYFSSDPAYLGPYNTSRIIDAELEGIALDMKNVLPTDKEGWLTRWQGLMAKYNELVVNLPLYSDEYHDFYAPELVDYRPFALWSWEMAILDAKLK